MNMKQEAALATISPRKAAEKKSDISSPPASAFGKLRRILSPKKNDKRPRLVLPDVPKCSEFERIFLYFDEDGDGKISPVELRSCIRMTGQELSLEDVEAVVSENDSDGDGLLGLDDFVKLVEVEEEDERRRGLREAFGMYEMEGSGCITPKSLKRMLGRLGESKTIEQCKAMISRYDLNGDGVLSFEEFRVMMV